MYLMYVDESGDCGLVNSPTRHFVLTGLVVHELRWQICLDQIIDFRRRMSQSFGLGMREEVHAAAFISRPGILAQRITRNDRLAILRAFADELASMSDLNLINVVVDKDGKASYDVFAKAWTALIQRFENTLAHRNFAGPQNPDDRGTLFPDHTDDKKLTLLLRKMRRYNPIPNQLEYGPGYRNIALTKIIEDPNFRASDHSYFIQAADLAAYLLYQSMVPNAYIKRKSAHNYFRRLEPILCKVASSTDPLGIVHL